MKKFIITLIALIVLVGLGFYIYNKKSADVDNIGGDDNMSTTTDQMATTTVDLSKGPVVAIGKSVEGKDITAYHFGTGETELMFIGGIHGAYEWNTSLVAYQLVDYLEQNPTVVPSNIKVTVIPVLNPDGLNKVIGKSGRFTVADVPKGTDVTVPGRFNANNVDLNRNFDCDWQASAKWQDKTVSGGATAFSEPESQSIRSYVETYKPTAVITWYSSAGGVYASNCHNGVSADTNTLTKTFATASGYKAYQEFNFYEITGDMVNWFAKNNIPAISVLLTNHTDTEWTKNVKGVEAVLKLYSK